MGSIIMSVIVIGLGVALGLARGGRLEALRAVRPQWWVVLAGGFVLQAFAESFDVPGATSLSVIGMFALVVGLVANAQIRGALIAAFGVSLNLIVMAINGAVPVRFEALSDAGIVASGTERSQITSVGHLLELETADSRLGSLGDTIPIGVLNSVISIGDVVTFAGVIVIVSNLIAARRTVGVEVDTVFALPIEDEPEIDVNDLTLSADLAEMFGTPEPDGQASVLDVAAAEPVIDVSNPDSSPMPVQLDNPIDLTFDPSDVWADEDASVRILGPTGKPNG